MTDRLEEGLERLAITASAVQIDRVRRYMEELLLWNNRLNLVSAADRDELVVRHILDSLAGFSLIEGLPGGTVADVGSGAGLPGLLLAIFSESKGFTLIERSGRKAGFLKSVSAVLGLRDRVEVLASDLKDVRGRYDVVTMRAFRNFADFYSGLCGITSESGCIAAFKGRLDVVYRELEQVDIGTDQAEIHPLDVPFLGEPRHLVMLPMSRRSSGV